MEQLKNKECKRRYNKISNLRKFILSRSLALKHSWSWTLVLALVLALVLTLVLDSDRVINPEVFFGQSSLLCFYREETTK